LTPRPVRAPGERSLRPAWALLIGVATIGVAMASGSSELLQRLLEPPFPLGLVLGIACALIGLVVVLRAAARIGEAGEDARALIRAIRLIFLAVGLFSAAAGWVIGTPVPIVAGLIIIGIDVLETTFLLLVSAARPGSTPRS
jgi:hypothetical protein